MPAEEPTYLRDIMSTVAKAQATVDEEAGLPSLRERDYKAFAAAANKPMFTLHCIGVQGTIRSFQYVDLDSDSRYEPGMIRLRFTGTKVLEVTIRGRNLWRLYDGIHRHVIAWVNEAGSDLAPDGECLVRAIEIAEIRQVAMGAP